MKKRTDVGIAREHARARDRQRRWRSIDACVQCGIPCAINPITQRPFWRCLRHRIAMAQYFQRTGHNTRER